MRHRHCHHLRRGTLLLAATLVIGSPSLVTAHDASQHASAQDHAHTEARPELAGEAPFLAENDAAMAKMMQDMAAKPTGDVDRDFVAMMAPHHQGAIDMAKALLRYGRNEQLKRMAQEIIVTQQQEIAAMHLAIGEPLPLSTPAPTQAAAPESAPDHH
jgi:uncharacterized protein (DUF305 family)